MKILNHFYFPAFFHKTRKLQLSGLTCDDNQHGWWSRHKTLLSQTLNYNTEYDIKITKIKEFMGFTVGEIMYQSVEWGNICADQRIVRLTTLGSVQMYSAYDNGVVGTISDLTYQVL